MPRTSNPLVNRTLLTVVGLLVFGHIMLFSATGVMGLERYQSEFYFVFRQGVWAIAGLVILLLLSFFPYQHWKKLAPITLLIVLVLVGLTHTSLARTIQGVTRWLTIGPLSFQPSEIAKIALPMYIAYLVEKYREQKVKPAGMLLLTLPVMGVLLLIFKQPDLGSTMLLAAMALSVVFLAGARWLYLLSSLALGATLMFGAMVYSEYRRRRLTAFLNPWADPQGSGFQTIQSFLSFHSGGIFGLGLGNGNSKLFFLPEVHTDFIFALVGEELGFVGAILLLIAFIHFGHLIMAIVRHAPDGFGRSLAFGLAITLIFQIVVNIGGVTGLLPVKGLPLPFISWGRSALVVNLAMVGILLNVARQSSIIREVARPKIENKTATFKNAPQTLIEV